MSDFKVRVYRLTIEPHPNADTIELARIGEYKSIVRKGEYKTGDLAIYIPEGAVVSQWLLKDMGLEGKLAGSNHDRVKSIKLRGELSTGLVYPLKGKAAEMALEAGVDGCNLADIDYANILGIVKYEPPIPVHMAGEVYAFGPSIPHFDIENYKLYPDVLQDGEEVVISEKAHRTFCVIGLLPFSQRDEKHWKGRFVVGSKGLASKGLVFKNTENNSGNLYVNMVKELGLDDKMFEIFGAYCDSTNQPVWIRGEIFGQGVQDLKYGQMKPTFRIFNAEIGWKDNSSWLPYEETKRYASLLGVEMVPELYVGPWSKDLLKLTDGMETISGKSMHIREGIVIRPTNPRREKNLGNVILKSVSEAYLLRKGDTTELQ